MEKELVFIKKISLFCILFYGKRFGALLFRPQVLYQIYEQKSMYEKGGNLKEKLYSGIRQKAFLYIQTLYLVWIHVYIFCSSYARAVISRATLVESRVSKSTLFVIVHLTVRTQVTRVWTGQHAQHCVLDLQVGKIRHTHAHLCYFGLKA